MTTTTIGSAPAINNWWFDGGQHQAWISVGASGGYSTGGNNLGRMVTVTSKFASKTGGSGGAVAWLDGSYSFHTAQTIAAGSGSSAPTTIYSSSDDKPFFGSTFWNFGMWCATGVYTAYHSDGGTSYSKTGTSGAIFGTNSPTHNYSFYGTGGGSQYAFGTYFIIEMYVRRGGAWVKAFTYPYRGGYSAIPQTYVRRGGGWTQVGHLMEGIAFDPYRSHEIIYQDEDGIWSPAIVRFEGPYYLGDREGTLYGVHEYPYELVAV